MGTDMTSTEFSESQFNENARQLLEALITSSAFALDTEMLAVYYATRRMCSQMRVENSEVITDSVSQMLNALLGQREEPAEWLSTTFEKLIQDKDSVKGWTAYLTLVNTANLISEVGQRYVEQGGILNDAKLHDRMVETSYQYIVYSLKPIILDLGGWSDIIDYERHIDEQRQRATTGERRWSYEPLIILGICCAILLNL